MSKILNVFKFSKIIYQFFSIKLKQFFINIKKFDKKDSHILFILTNLLSLKKSMKVKV